MLHAVVFLLLICAPIALMHTLWEGLFKGMFAGARSAPREATTFYFVTESEARAEAEKRNEAAKRAEPNFRRRKEWLYYRSQYASKRRPWLVEPSCDS